MGFFRGLNFMSFCSFLKRNRGNSPLPQILCLKSALEGLILSHDNTSSVRTLMKRIKA